MFPHVPGIFDKDADAAVAADDDGIPHCNMGGMDDDALVEVVVAIVWLVIRRIYYVEMPPWQMNGE